MTAASRCSSPSRRRSPRKGGATSADAAVVLDGDLQEAARGDRGGLRYRRRWAAGVGRLRIDVVLAWCQGDAEAALAVGLEGADLLRAVGVPDGDGGLVRLVGAGRPFPEPRAHRGDPQLPLHARAP